MAPAQTQFRGALSMYRSFEWRRLVYRVHQVLLVMAGALTALPGGPAEAGGLRAGAAKVDITNYDAGPVDGPMYARALVIAGDESTAVLVAVDAVSLGEIGYIHNEYLGHVRARIEQELQIPPAHVLINASHCHGIVCTGAEIEERTFEAVRQAMERLEPVKVGVGEGSEDGISENRRIKLKDGREIDVRHAYSMPADEDVAEVGPIDPEIGLLKLQALDGGTVAVVYNFACHPILGVPSGANTADFTGFASQVIEENSGDGAIALFVQGCAGDINPVYYKDVDHPRDAELLGDVLALSALRGLHDVELRDEDRLRVVNTSIELPRADLAQRIADMEAEQSRLVGSLQGTSLNLKTFIPLFVKYSTSGEFPSYYAPGYLQQEAVGKDDLVHLDETNRRNMEQYIQNILTMEQLTRVQTNLALLNKHQAQNVAAGKRTVDVEVVGLRVGEFVLLTFPGELTVQIGLNLKQASPHEHTFIAGYTNGYIYYSPTSEQLQNVGNAQEDSDCILAPEWQAIFEEHAVKVLREL